METLIKFNNASVGRDKLARLIQYSCRTLWYLSEKNKRNPDAIQRLRNAEYIFSTFRKLLRLGRSIDVLYSACGTVHLSDPILRHTCTLSRISQALFLFTDHVVWFGRTGLADVNLTKWSSVSNRYWLLSIVMNLIRDFYELARIVREDFGSTSRHAARTKNQLTAEQVAKSVYEHRDVVVDLIKNGCDLFIPMTALGHLKLSPGTVGFLGAVSSIAGIIPLIDPTYKLRPN